MQNLTLKEHKAIEYKYRGISHKEIAKITEVPKLTIDEWFKERGKLKPTFDEWSSDLNAKRQKKIEENYYVSDKEFAILSTTIVRRVASFILYGRKSPVIKKGKPVFDSEGNMKFRHEEYTPKVGDFIKMWKMQRVMQGRPTNITAKKCSSCKMMDLRQY